jgi:hypothetical protein
MNHRVLHIPDSFALFKTSGDNLFDVTITDPPFPERVQTNMCSGTLAKPGGGVPKYELPFDPLSDYTFVLDLLRMTRRWVIIKCSVEAFGEFRRVVGDSQYQRSAIWYKPNSMGQLTRDRPGTACEGIACMHKVTKFPQSWNGYGSWGMWKCNGTRGKPDRHPNEMPLDLCLKLVALFSQPWEGIFDPFAGSGAIGEAAKRLGREYYTGWDNDEHWVARANERLVTVNGTTSQAEALSLCKMKGEEAEG